MTCPYFSEGIFARALSLEPSYKIVWHKVRIDSPYNIIINLKLDNNYVLF